MHPIASAFYRLPLSLWVGGMSVPEEDQARREFSRLHGISMSVNLAVFVGGAVLLLGYETFRKEI